MTIAESIQLNKEQIARAFGVPAHMLADPDRTVAPRYWSLCMTSENHGTVGPAGCKFSHAPEKHERVLVVEVPAAAGAPTDQVNLQLVTSGGGQADVDRALRAAQAWANEEYMCGRRMGKGEPAMSDRAEAAKSECVAAILALAAPVAAQAGHVAVPEGWKLVPVEPTPDMVTSGFESVPDEFFSPGEDWDTYAAMTGCQKAAHRARLCYAAMLAAAPAAPAQAAPLPVQAAPASAERIECWSHNEEDFSAKSLGELIDTHELQPGATVWAGEAVHPEPSSLFSTDWVIENMGEAAYDIAGEHGGEDYPNVSDEQVAELEALVVGWITKCAPPTFWTVKNVRPYVLTAEDCEDQASTSGERQEGGAA
jgi:hypothetical protein